MFLISKIQNIFAQDNKIGVTVPVGRGFWFYATVLMGKRTIRPEEFKETVGFCSNCPQTCINVWLLKSMTGNFSGEIKSGGIYDVELVITGLPSDKSAYKHKKMKIKAIDDWCKQSPYGILLGDDFFNNSLFEANSMKFNGKYCRISYSWK